MDISSTQSEFQQAQEHLHFLLGFMLIFIAICWARKRHELGGWLLYFYGWMFLAVYFYLREFLGHIDSYFPSAQIDKARQLALIVTVVPRLLAMLAVLVVMIILSFKRDQVWLQRLKLGLGAAAMIAAISAFMDATYFPRTVPANLRRLIMLVVWLTYLCVSRRVNRVFITKDWVETTDPVRSQTILS
jgi:hypothetical protein